MIDDVAPQQVWQALADNPDAQLVDVRTDAEWAYVGLPELSSLSKRVLLIAWQEFPTGSVNPRFMQQLGSTGLTEAHDIYFICRSGARSLAAAQAARAAGYTRVYNVADGFEGPPDEQGHRGVVAGWKAGGLPWNQR